MEEMQQHQGEWFFLHELNVDKVFSTIQRADYLILYYIKVEQETHPGEKLYLANLAAAMGVRMTELSKGIEKLQDSGFVYDMLGIPMELYTPLFAVARVMGWSAHRIEELLSANKIIRPAYKSLGGTHEYIRRNERE